MTQNVLFSPVFGTNLCLSDKERVNSFEKAIAETIKKGDTVLDVGSGNGILTFLALKYGAGKVYAVEIDPYLCTRIKEAAEQNGFGSKVKIINKDIFQVNFINEKIDLVLMEMLTTGLIEESQILAYNHLIEKGIIKSSTKIMPQAYETYCIPLEYNFIEYGFCMPRAKHTALKDLREKLGGEKLLSAVKFDGIKKNPWVIRTVRYKIEKEGDFNALGLMGIAKLSKNVSLGESAWMNNSVVVPLKNRINVKEGGKIKLNIQYSMGSGFLNFEANPKRYLKPIAQDF